MARAHTRRRLSSGFNLGGQQAEADPLLELAFYETSQYRAISSTDDPHCFLFGELGVASRRFCSNWSLITRGMLFGLPPRTWGSLMSRTSR